jgi:hypothetical protein
MKLQALFLCQPLSVKSGLPPFYGGITCLFVSARPWTKRVLGKHPLSFPDYFPTLSRSHAAAPVASRFNPALFLPRDGSPHTSTKVARVAPSVMSHVVKRGTRRTSGNAPADPAAEDAVAVSVQSPAKKPRHVGVSDGIGYKGRRSGGNVGGDVVNRLQARVSELVALRDTGPERALDEHIRAAAADAIERAEACAFYKAEVLRLEKLLEAARVGVDIPEALRRERQRADELEKQVLLLVEQAAAVTAATPEPTLSTTGKERDDAGKPALRSNSLPAPAPAPAPLPVPSAPASLSALEGDPQQAPEVDHKPESEREQKQTSGGMDISAEREAAPRLPSGRSDGHLENSAKASVDQQTKMLEYVQRFAGIADVASCPPGRNGLVLTIRHPNDNRFVKFQLTDEGSGELSYSPIDINLPNAPLTVFFRDELDFTWESAPVLHRELLANVYEKGSKRMSTASTASKKRKA